MLGFMVGMVTGGAVGFYWRDQIRSYLDHRLPPVRGQVADGLRHVERSTSEALGRLRTEISARLRNGERWLRSGGQPSGNGVTIGTPDRP